MRFRNDPHDAPELSARTVRNILGSLLSAFVGWLTAVLVLLGCNLFTYFTSPQSERAGDSLWWWAIYAYFAAGFVFGTWLLLLLPLYTWVPLRWSLWRWPLCTGCGVTAGAAIMHWFLAFISPDHSVRISPTSPLVWIAALVGGASCLFASLTRHRFHPSPARRDV